MRAEDKEGEEGRNKQNDLFFFELKCVCVTVAFMFRFIDIAQTATAAIIQ